MNSKLLRHIILATLLLLNFAMNAQWTCPTKLNAHLKPFWDEGPLSWATETTVGLGLLDDRAIQNDMFFAGVEYYTPKLSIYAEGGLKYWSLWEDNQQLDNLRLGMRELYINPSLGKTEVRVGLQSLQFKDQFILNERAIGLSFKRNINGLTLEGAVGTVSERFARNGSFCSKCYLYDIVKDRSRSILGANPLDENFAAFVLTIDPSKRKKGTIENTNTQKDEFENFDEFESDDEFSSADEFNDTSDKMFSWIKVENYGLLAFSEFGQNYPNPRFWLGAYETIGLPFNINFKGEYLYQHQTENKGIILQNSFFGDFSWNKGTTSWNASYIYFIGIDKNSLASLSYTNLFLGEVLRLDAIEMPLTSVYLKHRFIGKGMSLKLQYAASYKADLSELDLQFNINIGKHFHLIATTAYISGADLKNPFLGRIEARFTF